MKVRRDIASIPVRSAGETWQVILDLITGAGSVDVATLKAASSVMESLIADEHPATAPRRCNSSSAFSENWGVAAHGTPEQIAANRRRGAFIQYADLSDLMLMLDMQLGGDVMAAVNEGQELVRPRMAMPSEP